MLKAIRKKNRAHDYKKIENDLSSDRKFENDGPVAYSEIYKNRWCSRPLLVCIRVPCIRQQITSQGG